MQRGGLALVAGAFLVVFGVGGLRQIFGVWVRPLEAEFGADRASVALAASFSLLAFGLGQPILGRLVDAHGPRLVIPGSVLLAGVGTMLASFAGTLWLFALAFGLIASAGFAGASNATVAAMVSQRFEERRGLIIGICSAGAPLGQLLLAPLAALSIAAFGWRDTMAILGAAALGLVFPIAWALLRRMPAPSEGTVPSLGGTYRSALRSRGFWLLFSAYFLCGMTTLGLVHTHIVPYGVDIGLPEVNAANILGLVGGVNVAGLVLAGQAADRWGGARPLIVAFAVRSLTLLWVATATDQTTLVLFALVFGLTDMATIPLAATAAAGLFGPRMIGAVMGLLTVAHQTGSALGSFLAGLGYQTVGGYPSVMVVGAGLAATAALLAIALRTSGERRAASDEPGSSRAPAGPVARQA